MPPKPKRARGGDVGGAAAQRSGRQGGKGGRDSRRAAPSAREEDGDDDDALADSDEEARDGGAGVAGEEEEEDLETAGEKRLRLAKAYLSSLRSELAADRVDDDEEEGDGDGEGVAGDARVAARLAADAGVARGDTQRPLGQALRVPSASDPQQGTLWGGHQRPVTAVALSGDDRAAVAASKDGTVLLYDVETAARTRVPQAPPVPTQTVRALPDTCARWRTHTRSFHQP
jgi:ribosomal RNA-processing protein 9